MSLYIYNDINNNNTKSIQFENHQAYITFNLTKPYYFLLPIILDI